MQPTLSRAMPGFARRKSEGAAATPIPAVSASRDLCSMVEYNIRLVETDGSEGVHNEKYTVSIYDASDAMLKTLGY